MKQEREQDIRHWQTNVLRILQNEEIALKRPVLLDINELLPLIDLLDLKPNRRSDVKRNFKKQSAKFETVFNNDDHIKMNEIIEKLTAKEEKYTDKSIVKLTTIGGILKSA